MDYKRNCEIKNGMEFPEGMQRIALGLEYNGHNFHGFQKQKSADVTIQAALEGALSSVANEPLSLICAGRTDAGVHATNQVVHFDTLAQRPDTAWLHGVNSQLPEGLRVQWVKAVGPEFHARFSAHSRTYRYLLCCSSVRPAILSQQLSWTQWQLDEQRMHAAAQYLLGEQDFSSFRAAQCQAASPVRTVQEAAVKRFRDVIVFEVQANAFLYHMVRNMMGALMEVGRSAREPAWLKTLLALKDRRQAPAMASPLGLYLVDVGYPERFTLPRRMKGPMFVPELG